MDQIAVNFAMGHADRSMAAVYRQGIDDFRLVNVAMHVHKRLFNERSQKSGLSRYATELAKHTASQICAALNEFNIAQIAKQNNAVKSCSCGRKNRRARTSSLLVNSKPSDLPRSQNCRKRVSDNPNTSNVIPIINSMIKSRLCLFNGMAFTPPLN